MVEKKRKGKDGEALFSFTQHHYTMIRKSEAERFL